MKSRLFLEIITPEKIVFQGQTDMVVAPGTEGVIGVLPGHIPLFSRLEPGELKIIREGKKNIFIALAGGFIQVQPEKVTILADTATRAESINEAKVLEARKKAESLLAKKVSDVEFAKAEASLRKALAELRVAQHQRWRQKRTIKPE